MMASSLHMTVVERCEVHCDLGESPLWRPASHNLAWVDATRGCLHTWQDGVVASEQVTTGLLSAIVGAVDAGLVLFMDRTVAYRTSDGAKLREIARLPGDTSPERFNDAAVGPEGEAWVSTVAEGHRHGGGLWSLDSAGDLRNRIQQVTHGNGVAWSPDGSWMYLVDSGEGTVSRIRYGGLDDIGRPELLFSLDRDLGLPDGLSVDTEGRLWLAVWGGYGLIVLDPDGVVLGRVQMQERNVTSCCFSGVDLDLLAVTTAADEITPDAPGGLTYLLDVGAKGVALPVWRGRP